MEHHRLVSSDKEGMIKVSHSTDEDIKIMAAADNVMTIESVKTAEGGLEVMRTARCQPVMSACA